MYITLSEKEKNDLLSRNDKPVYKMIGHSWTPLKGVGKNYCKTCGLVALNNNFTRWCIDKGCLSEYHSQYDSAKKRLMRRD